MAGRAAVGADVEQHQAQLAVLGRRELLHHGRGTVVLPSKRDFAGPPTFSSVGFWALESFS
ncbi:MAG: hypothetical protein U0835_18290 [Isosphaeraceae bacterium]